ncbi:alpha/beta hydrolase [Actibacterium pelagium]|uniref:Esterase/lipase superfamily enzyme n=1 Tax=Actibacterium pelagium TaxID=2029103 RepID=A0A917EKW0_9RHOB|nr:alpha/beta fold hydrolase [Actibacterium pelagium]GGE55318.1 hypothetical protein GCM10011517_23630 [Actibacterium pelagium]
MVRPFVCFFFLTLVAACGPRPDLTVLPEANDIGDNVDVYFSTTRVQKSAQKFSRERTSEPAYGRIVVSVPPEHEQGKVETRARNPNPAQDFVATELVHYDPAAFRRSIRTALQRRPAREREVIVFVHGFNTTFGESVYRAAQLAHDFRVPGVNVFYSWPSAAHVFGYTHDRDSILFARDGLEELLIELNKTGATRVNIVAHSMGSALTMEALRQIAIRSPGQVDALVDGVILISPDLDVDLFRQQASRIGRLPQPFFVFTSRKDRALAVSSRLNGATNRLGNLKDVSQVADLDITVLNVSNFGEGVGHFTIGSSPALINLLSGFEELENAFRTDASGRNGLLPATVLTVRNATEVILGAPN